MPQDSITLEDIQRRATLKNERIRIRQREHYQLAKDLGFSPAVAQIVSGWSRERILALHKNQKELS